MTNLISLPADVVERRVRTERAPLASALNPGSTSRCPYQMASYSISNTTPVVSHHGLSEIYRQNFRLK